MKIKRPTDVEVTFESHGEAARWLAGYCSWPNEPGIEAIKKEFHQYPNTNAEDEETIKAALTKLAQEFGYTLGGPTYISGSSDKVYVIRSMPTRYIRNVLNMDGTRQALGLRNALVEELARRGESV